VLSCTNTSPMRYDSLQSNVHCTYTQNAQVRIITSHTNLVENYTEFCLNQSFFLSSWMAVLVYLWKVKYKQMSAIYVSAQDVSNESTKYWCLKIVLMPHCVNMQLKNKQTRKLTLLIYQENHLVSFFKWWIITISSRRSVSRNVAHVNHKEHSPQPFPGQWPTN